MPSLDGPPPPASPALSPELVERLEAALVMLRRVRQQQELGEFGEMQRDE